MASLQLHFAFASFTSPDLKNRRTAISTSPPPPPPPPPSSTAISLSKGKLQRWPHNWGNMHMSVRSLNSQSDGDTEESGEVEDSSSFSMVYGAMTGLATLGFLETAYLTYEKASGGLVSCPIGGGNCNDVLQSDYSVVFGIPLPAIGTLAYGTVAMLSALAVSKAPNDTFTVDIVRWLLLGSTGSMASASIYFIYILLTKFEGASCAYCVGSATLSVILLLLTLRVRENFFSKLGSWITNRFSFQEAKRVVGLQVAATAAVIVALSSSYAGITPALTGSGEIDLPPVEPQVTTSSSPSTISLAKQLQAVGAKMYGAFWCSHCFQQKQMFGREAVKLLDYVECYPEGYRRGVKIAKACADANIDGFPTWIIKGEVLSGEQDLSELAKLVGLEGFDAQK